MKIEQLLAIRRTFSRISEKIPFQTAYKIARFLKYTESEEAFYNTKYKDILDEYLERDASGKFAKTEEGYKIKKGMTDKCSSMLNELSKTDVELPCITFTVDEFADMKISTEDMLSLYDLINIEKEV